MREGQEGVEQVVIGLLGRRVDAVGSDDGVAEVAGQVPDDVRTQAARGSEDEGRLGRSPTASSSLAGAQAALVRGAGRGGDGKGKGKGMH